MSFSPIMQRLQDALRCLPGVGCRTAQRMMLHLLERERGGGYELAEAIKQAVDKIGNCSRCRALTEYELCQICLDQNRCANQLCVVETPADMLAIEMAGSYRGYYFVLLGHLSPIDGIGPEQLGLDQLNNSLAQVKEVILATNPTVEGETTAHYISEQLKQNHAHINVTRIAHGVPVGGELEFIDSSTLMQAFVGRRSVERITPESDDIRELAQD